MDDARYVEECKLSFPIATSCLELRWWGVTTSLRWDAMSRILPNHFPVHSGAESSMPV